MSNCRQDRQVGRAAPRRPAFESEGLRTRRPRLMAQSKIAKPKISQTSRSAFSMNQISPKSHPRPDQLDQSRVPARRADPRPAHRYRAVRHRHVFAGAALHRRQPECRPGCSADEPDGLLHHFCFRPAGLWPDLGHDGPPAAAVFRRDAVHRRQRGLRLGRNGRDADRLPGSCKVWAARPVSSFRAPSCAICMAAWKKPSCSAC